MGSMEVTGLTGYTVDGDMFAVHDGYDKVEIRKTRLCSGNRLISLLVQLDPLGWYALSRAAVSPNFFHGTR